MGICPWPQTPAALPLLGAWVQGEQGLSVLEANPVPSKETLSSSSPPSRPRCEGCFLLVSFHRRQKAEPVEMTFQLTQWLLSRVALLEVSFRERLSRRAMHSGCCVWAYGWDVVGHDGDAQGLVAGRPFRRGYLTRPDPMASLLPSQGSLADAPTSAAACNSASVLTGDWDEQPAV